MIYIPEDFSNHITWKWVWPRGYRWKDMVSMSRLQNEQI